MKYYYQTQLIITETSNNPEQDLRIYKLTHNISIKSNNR